jgi:hypothetical protein
MKRWFWILDTVAVLSFAFIGSDFHGFSFDLPAIMGVAAPFLIALGVGVAVLRARRDPLTIVSGLFLALIASIGGLLLRFFVWGDGTATAFVLVTGAFFIATMVGWRLIVLAVAWIFSRSGSAGAAT